MLSKARVVWIVPLVVGVAIGAVMTGSLGLDRIVQAGSGVGDNLPPGRTALPIEDGQYAASYFPNTEVLGAGEMRITAPRDRRARRELALTSWFPPHRLGEPAS